MASKSMWMVRAGEGAWLIEDFERDSFVSIGWKEMGDLSALRTRDEFVKRAEAAYPSAKKGQIVGYAGQPYRFVREIRPGDAVITYKPSERTYLVGTIEGEYEFSTSVSVEHPNIRRVKWRGRVNRDNLSVATRNSLGAISTLFLVTPDAATEIERQLVAGASAPPSSAPPAAPTVEEQVDDLYKDLQARALEFIKDKLSQLDWDEMQDLVAGLLRAMGYKTKVSPSGSDRGKDIIASPDGLGFEDPRIVVEVKHRTAAMGSQEIRSFLGGRHDRDKGLYVSTGGFTKEARYEAERGRIPITLMDLDDLAHSVLEHYEAMDGETKRLLPLRRIYWPA
jgi:restriction system protein